eukprot:gene17817-21219_t
MSEDRGAPEEGHLVRTPLGDQDQRPWEEQDPPGWDDEEDDWDPLEEAMRSTLPTKDPPGDTQEEWDMLWEFDGAPEEESLPATIPVEDGEKERFPREEGMDIDPGAGTPLEETEPMEEE